MKHENTVETIPYKGFTIDIVVDTNPIDPRGNDNIGKMACWHRAYCLGDHELTKRTDPETFTTRLCLENINKRKFETWYKSHEFEHEKGYYEETFEQATIQQRLEYLKSVGFLILPLFLYDHSGITISTSRKSWPFNCPWDTSSIGFIYASPDTIKKEYGNLGKKAYQKAANYLYGEVEEYDDYLTGNVYGFITSRGDEDHIDSCWGFSGEFKKSGIIEAAKESIDYEIQQRIKTNSQRLKGYVLNKVALEYRKPFELGSMALNS